MSRLRYNTFPYGLVVVLLLIAACENTPHSENQKNRLSRAENIKLKQYMVAGEILYLKHCGNCHMEDGKGLKRLIPPLTDERFFNDTAYSLACIVKHGITGDIIVNDTLYNQPMPGNPQLTNLEIAEISTFVYNRFLNETRIVLPDAVKKDLSRCNLFFKK